MAQHRFGGQWTEEKLKRVRKYLAAYMKIFTKNPRAARLKTTYVDAFAGTGFRTPETGDESCLPLFEDKDACTFQKGSAQIALETEPSFDHYIFVEHKSEFADELEKLQERYPEKSRRIRIVREDANLFIQSWCKKVDWRYNRAVVFLDPYGMEVEWKTIETIARTKGIDLWILFPLGQDVNRLLTRNSPPEGARAKRLTTIFGTEDWKDAFYRKRRQLPLFETEEEPSVKKTDFDGIGQFFINRLKTIFPGVAEPPLPLINSRNIPIYWLCFAASNENGAPTAVNIAQSNILIQ